MGLKVVTPAGSEPISVTEAKLQCQIDTTDWDTLLPLLIAAARAKVEADSGGTVQVVEMRDERGRIGPNGKPLGGYHLALRFTTPQTGKGATAKPGAAPKPAGRSAAVGSGIAGTAGTAESLWAAPAPA